LWVDWQPKHITIGLFKASDTFGHALAKDLIELLNKYDLRKKNIAYIKNEGSNLNTMVVALKYVINCDILCLVESFWDSCFGHAFSKACQYVLANEKVCKGLKYVFVKTT
jgi:hypothetical protein